MDIEIIGCAYLSICSSIYISIVIPVRTCITIINQTLWYLYSLYRSTNHVKNASKNPKDAATKTSHRPVLSGQQMTLEQYRGMAKAWEFGGRPIVHDVGKMNSRHFAWTPRCGSKKQWKVFFFPEKIGKIGIGLPSWGCLLLIDVLGKMGIGLEGVKEVADWKQFVCEDSLESLEESLNKLAFSFSWILCQSFWLHLETPVS